MVIESVIAVVMIGFSLAIAAVAVPMVAFCWTMLYKAAIEPQVNKLPQPVQKWLRALLEIPDIRPQFLRKLAGKKAR